MHCAKMIIGKHTQQKDEGRRIYKETLILDSFIEMVIRALALLRAKKPNKKDHHNNNRHNPRDWIFQITPVYKNHT
jgi:hypothetical protein